MRHIKLVLASLALAALQGCTVMGFIKEHAESFWLARWDAHESALVAEVSIQAYSAILVCDTDKNTKEQQVATLASLVKSSRHLSAYSRTLPDDNSAVILIAKNIEDSSTEFYQRAQNKMSRVYCESKSTGIQAMTEQAQRAVQAKRR